MPSNLLDNPKLFRHLVEHLPVGIYIVDQEQRIRFWNHGAEHLTGHLSHDVVGHVLEDAVQICDRRGNPLQGESCPVTRTLIHRKPEQCTASYLHKNGHRTAMRVRTQPILEYGKPTPLSLSSSRRLFRNASNHRDLPCTDAWMQPRAFLRTA